MRTSRRSSLCRGDFALVAPDTLTTTVGSSDDFTDGDYTSNPTWTVASGTWSAANNYLTKTSAAQGAIKRSFAYKDYSVKFSYYCEDTSNNNYVLSPQLRYIDGTHYVYVKFYPNKAHIDLQNGSGTYQDNYNWNCTTSQDTWYDVTVRCDGKYIDVWRGLQGQDQTRVFSKSCRLLKTNFIKFQINANAVFRIGNIVFTAPDPVATQALSAMRRVLPTRCFF